MTTSPTPPPPAKNERPESAFHVFSTLMPSWLVFRWTLLVIGIAACIDFKFNPDQEELRRIGTIIIFSSLLKLFELHRDRSRAQRRLLRHPLVLEGRSLCTAAGYVRAGLFGREGCLVLTRDEWVFSLIHDVTERSQWVTLFTLPHTSISKVQAFPSIPDICGHELLLSGPAIADVRITLNDPVPFAAAFEALQRDPAPEPTASSSSAR